MAKKKNTRREIDEDLDGFKEIIDLMDESQKKQMHKITQDSRQSGNTFELYSFLEAEVQRLKKLDILFTQKLYALDEYSQTETLLKEQKDTSAQFKRHLIRRLKTSDSPLQQSLKRIFNGSLY